MDRFNRFLCIKVGNTELTVKLNQRTSEILNKLIHCVFWILVCIDHGDGTTLCTQASAHYSLPVASMCYQTSVTSNRVVLDGFLTYQSSTTACSCTLMSSKSTTVRFVALNNLHPNHVNCGNVIRVQSGGTTIIVSCYVSGDVQVSPSQTATLSFDKPAVYYDSGYCMLFNSDDSTAVLTLSCTGDLNFPTSTLIPPTTLSTTTTTTLPSKSPTTPVQTTTPTTTTRTTTKTTAQRITTTTTTTLAPITTVLSQVTTVNAIISTLSTTASQLATTNQSTIFIHTQSSTSSLWSQTIPALGAGIVLICIIVLVVCFRYRRKYKRPSNDRTVVYVNATKINLPYSPDYKYEEGSSEIARESSTHIYDVIL